MNEEEVQRRNKIYNKAVYLIKEFREPYGRALYPEEIHRRRVNLIRFIELIVEKHNLF